MGPHSEARPICEFSPDHGHVMILYDTLADDGCHLNNPLGRGMESMIVSRTKVDHCLKNNDDVDGEYDMIMVIMCRLRILRRMVGTW